MSRTAIDQGQHSPAISVIMAAFNEEATIERAIRSIQNQSFTDWELIVVNDGSTDRTQEIVERICAKDRRIFLFNNPTNLRLPKSLNIGIGRARGDLIARADADDVNLAHRLEIQYMFMRRNPHIDVAGSAAWLLDAKGVRAKIVEMPLTHVELNGVALCKTHFFHSSVIIRRRFFEKVGVYAPQFIRAEDKELWYRGLRAGCQYANVREALVEYSTNDYKRSWRSIYYELSSLMKIGAIYQTKWRILNVARTLLYSVLVKANLYKPLR